MNSGRKFYKQMTVILLLTAFLLLIPLIAMQFTDEVKWSFFDFIIAGFLLISTGLAYVLLSQKMNATMFRVAVGIAVGASLLLIWVNLAVGIIGNENNPANIMYYGVPFIGIIGAFIAHGRPKGMSTTLFIMAAVQIIIFLIAIFILEPHGDVKSTSFFVIGHIFFAMLFVSSGLLFRKAAID